MGAYSQNNVPKYLLYKPRLTLYEVLFACNIKDCHTNTWKRGYCYREVDKPNAEVWSRPLDSFDTDKDKWEIFYS